MSGYSKLYHAIKSAQGDNGPGAPLWLRRGTVLSASPLKVDVGGTTQEAGRFYAAARLLDGFSGQFTLQGEEYTGDATIIQQGPALARGDRVLLLTDDDQTFYLIDKVVHL